MKELSTMDQMFMVAQNIGDEMIRYHFLKEMMKQEFFSKEERERLVNDTAQEVLSRIHATVDVTDVIEKIEEIEKALKKLGK